MKNLALAYSKAIADFAPVLKTATNPAFRSRYATLADVQDAIMPSLAKHGLVVFQTVSSQIDENGTEVTVGARLYHIESGEETFQALSMRPVQATPQGIGSTITYGRRYVLMTMFGLVGEDDDGEAASRPVKMATGVMPHEAHPSGAGKIYQVKAGTNLNAETIDPQRWTSSQQAAAWAQQKGAYPTLPEAQDAWAIFYKARVVDPKHPTPAEKADVFEAWYKLHTAP